MEKQPSFERIIGGTENQKKKIAAQAEKASQKTGEELFGKYLAIPTAEEQKTIEQSVAYANSIAKEYGAVREFDNDRIFLLQPGAVESLSNGKIKGGVTNAFNQSIGVERSFSNALLALAVVHEMLHMDSYHSSQVTESRSFLMFKKIGSRPYRSGISMNGREGEGEYFGVAEEAIIATLSKRFFDEVIVSDPLYKNDLENTKKIKQWLITFAEKHIPEDEQRSKFIRGIQEILILPETEKVYKELQEPDKDDQYKAGYFMGFFEENFKAGNIFHERNQERIKFDSVLDKIVADSKGKIPDKNQLLDEFARAHFTGNYLPLARRIESALGEGTFRKIAIELGNMRE